MVSLDLSKYDRSNSTCLMIIKSKKVVYNIGNEIRYLSREEIKCYTI